MCVCPESSCLIVQLCADCYKFLFSKHECSKRELSPSAQTTWWLHFVSGIPLTLYYYYDDDDDYYYYLYYY